MLKSFAVQASPGQSEFMLLSVHPRTGASWKPLPQISRSWETIRLREPSKVAVKVTFIRCKTSLQDTWVEVGSNIESAWLQVLRPMNSLTSLYRCHPSCNTVGNRGNNPICIVFGAEKLKKDESPHKLDESVKLHLFSYTAMKCYESGRILNSKSVKHLVAPLQGGCTKFELTLQALIVPLWAMRFTVP